MGNTSTCYRCLKERSKADFIQRVDDRHYGMCRHCLSEILTLRASGKRRLPHTDTHRICYLCRRVLAASEFTRRSNGTYFSACKECNRHVFAQRRRARLLQAEGEYTLREWLDLLAQHPHCPGCRRLWADIPLSKGRKTAVTVDHIIPVSKGGRNSIENLQPLCFSCNSRKSNKITDQAGKDGPDR
ncbi:HNH endonuclease [Microvirga roseola]|uniref:HNH endonuclease n=1 Tax=Microvirga roseola TaxID=2883126 RepID=UPI00389918BF